MLFLICFICCLLFFTVRITSGGGVKGKQSLSHRISAGWRARRSARDESLVEGEEGLASFTPSRRQFYSRTLSRDLPLKTNGEDFQRASSRNSWDASTSSGTIPRTGTTTGSTLPKQFNQESSDRIASVNPTSIQNTRTIVKDSNTLGFRERPFSTIHNVISSGEASGRVGGNFEQQDKSTDFLQSNKESSVGNQSVQQLKELVSELESVSEENLDNPGKTKAKSSVFLTTGHKYPLQSPKPSKSFTSLKMQQQPLINSSNSNPNIVFSITISSPRQQPLSKNSFANSDEMNKEKNTFQTSEKINSIKSNESNQSDSGSCKIVPKNTFIPYKPVNLNVDKSTAVNKQNTCNSISLNNVKTEKVSFQQWTPSLQANDSEKKKSSGLNSVKLTETVKTDSTNLGPALKKYDTIKTSPTIENKYLLTVEPYRRGRSEDLKGAIDLANSSSSSTIDSNRLIKPYRKSKSRDITPTIEAASERFTQLNSGTLRKISPFEAYKRSKSKELGSAIDLANNYIETGMKSPPPLSESLVRSDSAMSQFEKAKTSIEKKFEKARSPPMESENVQMEISSNCKSLNQESRENTSRELAKETEKLCKETEKPKSVYKILTTKFSRSLSNLGEDKQDKLQTKDTNTEETEKEEKFKLKRPSIFTKAKMEKSSSKTSIAENENKDDETDKNDNKKGNKLSYALNKFLGRKVEDNLNKINKNDSINLPKKSTSVAVIPDKVKKPPRFRTKKFSKSQENLNRGDEEDIDYDRETRAKSVFPESEQKESKIENETKDICNHLSQIEINITSQITNTSPNIEIKPTTINSSKMTNHFPSSAVSYGVAPTLIRKRSNIYSNSDKDSPDSQPELDLVSKKKLSGEFSEDGSVTPTESGTESTPSGLEDIKETEDESVMDRITRKSYYTRFNDMKRKSKSKRIDSRETMDQQLAAAKARLMLDETKQEKLLQPREITSPSRTTPQRSFTSISPPIMMDGVIRRISKGTLPRTISLPPEDGYIGGIRSPPFNRQEDSFKLIRYPSLERDSSSFSQSNSITREGLKPYRRQLSTNLDEALNSQKRLPSVPREDSPFFLRQPSVPKDDQTTFRLPSGVKDETPTFRRLSAVLKDEPKFQRSSQAKDHRLSSSNLKENTNDKRNPSIPRDNIRPYRRSISQNEHPINEPVALMQNEEKNNQYSSPYRKVTILHKDETSPTSPTNVFQPLNKDSDNKNDNYEKTEVFAAASAAGKAAGEAAAAAAISPTQRLNSPLSNISASDPAAVKSAREELTRRLTPLTRLSSIGSGEYRPYRRTVTSGSLPLGQQDTSKNTNITTLERPYRRTTTTDLPPLDSRIRTNEARRFQEPTRRFSGIRSTENGIDSIRSSPSTFGSSSRLPYSSYVLPSSSSPLSPSQYQSPPSMNTILRRTSLYRY